MNNSEAKCAGVWVKGFLEAKSKEMGIAVDFSDKEYNGDLDPPMDMRGFLEYIFSIAQSAPAPSVSVQPVKIMLTKLWLQLNEQRLVVVKKHEESESHLTNVVMATIANSYTVALDTINDYIDTLDGHAAALSDQWIDDETILNYARRLKVLYDNGNPPMLVDMAVKSIIDYVKTGKP